MFCLGRPIGGVGLSAPRHNITAYSNIQLNQVYQRQNVCQYLYFSHILANSSTSFWS